MGRRPHAVVFQFFERGQKLSDSSNRYEHTCKQCGELFPKGRLDSLIGHILRRCANITQLERDLIKSQIKQITTNRRQSRNSTLSASGFPQNCIDSQLTQFAPSLEELQPHPHQQTSQPQSALDTLAEVSRQQLDYSSQPHILSYDNNDTGQEYARDLVEQTLLAHLRHVAENDHISDNLDIYSPVAVHPQARDELDLTNSTEALAASPLVQAASAANEQLEQAQHTRHTLYTEDAGTLDPLLERPKLVPVIENSVESEIIATTNSEESWHQASHTSVPTEIESNEFSTPFESTSAGYGLFATGTIKARARNRFTDIRRKEVQEIRKRGACIRCRMLKKSCSEGTPCGTCARVESARLWKGKCLRTRVADEFVLWSTNLFHARAAINVVAAVHGLDRGPLPGRIELRLFSDSDLCMSFACKGYTPLGGSSLLHKEGNKVVYLLDEGDGMADKLHAYFRENLTLGIADESNAFLRATLQEALRLSIDDRAFGCSTNLNGSGRSCYSLQDDLVRNVIELWIATRLLTFPHEISLQFQYNPEMEPVNQLEQVWWREEAEKSSNMNMILSQILSAAETHCSRLSKNIMHELERRLLQRQQVSGFATFISTVLLLNCVERMTGLYRSFDVRCSSSPDHASQNPAKESQAVDVDWPLDEQPRNLWIQGRHFSELMVMLLRMRALPPGISCTEHGFVVARPEQATLTGVNGRPIRDVEDEGARAAAIWLDPIRLHVDDLLAKRHAPDPDPEAGVQAWDLRFISELLLPMKKDS